MTLEAAGSSDTVTLLPSSRRLEHLFTPHPLVATHLCFFLHSLSLIFHFCSSHPLLTGYNFRFDRLLELSKSRVHSARRRQSSLSSRGKIPIQSQKNSVPTPFRFHNIIRLTTTGRFPFSFHSEKNKIKIVQMLQLVKNLKARICIKCFEHNEINFPNIINVVMLSMYFINTESFLMFAPNL